MDTQVLPDKNPALFRFLDSFLHERNIKWVLAVGMLILLGSTCMLVAAYWHAYTPAWKYLIMLGYTGLIHGAGQWSFHRLGLRKTGTVLMVLTVLLLPVLFFALHWVQALTAATTVGSKVLNLVLFGATAAFATLAARRIFAHLLHGSQPTFLVSYLILSVAAGLAPALPPGAAPWASLLLWAVFVVGTVKVNRHVFWLTEQNRVPRIFGFFPIALLGALFLAVFGVNFFSNIALEWLGLGCLLVAVPVLLTADTVARVFQQRSGGLIRQQPAAIVVPLLVGLTLNAAGMVLAGAGLMPNHSPLAITPTAALAAVTMAMVARRIPKPAFVWALLVAITAAYNFSPFWFRELALAVMDAGAAMVQEERLPHAFYGLAYLPLIAVFTAAAVITHRAGNRLFSEPLQIFSAALSAGLVLLSLDYPKAILPVGVPLTLVLAVQAVLYQRPWIGGTAMVLAYLTGSSAALALGMSIADLLSLVTLALLGQWGLRHGFVRAPEARLTRTFGGANRVLAGVGLGLLFLGFYLPWSVAGCVFYDLGPDSLWPWTICRVLIVAWAFDAARCSRRPLLAIIASIGVLALAGAMLMNAMGSASWSWLSILWVAIAGAALPLTEAVRRRLQQPDRATADVEALYRAVVRPIERVILVVFSAAAGASLVVYTLPLWVAGGLASAGLLTLAALHREPVLRLRCLVLVNWQLIALTVIAFAPPWLDSVLALNFTDAPAICLPVALVAAISLIAWRRYFESAPVASAQRLLLATVVGLALVGSLELAALTPMDIALAGLSFGLFAAAELTAACRQQRETRVWIAEAVIAAGVGYFALQEVITFARGWSMFIVLGVGLSAWAGGRLAESRSALAVLARPLLITGLVMPGVTVALGLFHHLTVPEAAWLGQNSLALLLAAGFYFWYGLEYRQRASLLLAAVILNLALMLLWRELSWTDPQFYMVPVGITLLAIAQLLRDEIPARFHTPLHYLGALVILVSPLFHIATGSWLHLFTLMLGSVAVVLVAIGLRIRALVYTGTAFLAADLVAMIVRGSVDNPSLLWIAGLLLGAAVVALGAVAESHREQLLQRLRALSATLESWD